MAVYEVGYNLPDSILFRGLRKMPQHETILRRQCLRILTGSTLAVTTGMAFTNRTSGTSLRLVQDTVSQTTTETDKFRDWPDFLGPSRDGCSPVKISQRDWSSGNLLLRWKHPLGEGYAMGSLLEQHFFQTYKKAGNEILDCLDLQTGKIHWSQQRPSQYRDLYGYDSGPRCSPVLADGMIYQYGVDGVLLCRQASDGSLVWQRDLNADYQVVQNFFGVGSTPLLHQDKLLVMVGGSPKENLKLPPGALDRVVPNGTAIVALDRKTGDELFRVGDDLASYSSPVLGQFQTDLIGLAFCRGGLLGFNPDDGTQLFHYPHRSSKLESVNAATPIVGSDQVLISETYGVGSALLQFDPSTKQCNAVWKDDPESREQSLQAHWNTPVRLGDYVYASSGRHSGNAELRCVRWRDGKVQWSQPGLQRCSLTLAGEDLVVVGERGELHLIKANPEKFELVTTHSFPAGERSMRYPAWAAAIVVDGSLLVRDAEHLYCFDI